MLSVPFERYDDEELFAKWGSNVRAAGLRFWVYRVCDLIFIVCFSFCSFFKKKLI